MKKVLHLMVFLGFTSSLISQTCNSTLPVTEHFDSDTIGVCWDIQDQDGDGYDWYWREYYSGGNYLQCITSRSWNASGALTPDNWIFSYAIDLTSFSTNDNIELSWKVRGENASFSHEYYSVYAATGNQISDFESSSVVTSEYADEVGATGVFVTRSMDISNLAGNMVYIAFRHHDSTNQYILNIDDVSITTNALGIEEILQGDTLTHFYNAQTNTLTVKTNNTTIDTVKVFNILGQNVITKNIQQTESNINLSSLKTGVYIGQIIIQGTEKTFKFIKS